MKKKLKPPRKELLEFLEPELQEFVKDVTDFTKKRWLKKYDKEILSETIADCYEWCHGNGKLKNIGSTVATFLKDKPKRIPDDVVKSLRLIQEEIKNDS